MAPSKSSRKSPREGRTAGPMSIADASHVLEVDTTDANPTNDDDSVSPSSISITSSIVDYEYENGRRYNAYRRGAYPLPNDEQEQARLDLLHHIFLLMLEGSLHLADIEASPGRVLDIGTGTGIWATDFADQHPKAEVIGTDLSPIQPSWIPSNASFYIDDAESEWDFSPEKPFTYIHGRGLGGSIGDWDKLIAQSKRHLRPGGWLEFQEPEAWMRSDDDTLSNTEYINKWQTLCNDAAKQFQKEIGLAPTLRQRLIDGGLVDVTEKVVKVPIGTWPKNPKMKEIGRYELEHAILGIEPYTLGFIGKVLGWTEDECRFLSEKVIEELKDPKNHLYIRFYFVCGRKPEA